MSYAQEVLNFLYDNGIKGINELVGKKVSIVSSQIPLPEGYKLGEVFVVDKAWSYNETFCCISKKGVGVGIYFFADINNYMFKKYPNITLNKHGIYSNCVLVDRPKRNVLTLW